MNYYTMASAKGNIFFMWNLSNMCEYDIVVKHNIKLALKWYEGVDELGDTMASYKVKELKSKIKKCDIS